MSEEKILLKAEGIDKHFGITHAVDNVSINIAPGEIRALIGENGSGKSTFCQMLCGIYTKDAGTFTLDGQVMNIKNQVEANRMGVSIIEAALIVVNPYSSRSFCASRIIARVSFIP